MDLRQLRYFTALAEELNFTRAAARLAVATPALSRQIRRLEDELGVLLVERGRTGAILTVAGQALLPEARAALASAERAVAAARRAAGQTRAAFNVGYLPGFFDHILPGAVAEFRTRNPTLDALLFDLSAAEQMAGLRAGRLDLGLMAIAGEFEAGGLEKKVLGACPFEAALPRRHPAAGGDPLPLAQLAGEPLVGIAEEAIPGIETFTREICRWSGFTPALAQVEARGQTVLDLVGQGKGFALAPATWRALSHPEVVFCRLEPTPMADLCALWRAGDPGPLRRAFLALLGAR